MKIDLLTVERRARRTMVHLISAMGLLTIGQLSAATALADSEQADRAAAWAALDPVHADALRRYRACKAIRIDECLAEAAAGRVRKELATVVMTDPRFARDLPAPSRWFLVWLLEAA